ncbi:MAG: ABC transporter ATP-binding protein [Clostridiaceae bacterium]|jgi:ABC-2 type transport system ATP-binding protein|nr:ABC transporter ATP-binding protein [Clostridiaceae bacterium]
MLKVRNLSKRFDKVQAVDNVSFEVEPGEIAVLLGPNGAGKTTTIKSIAGLLRFEGQILINSIKNKEVEAKRVFGYIPESPSFYENLTVWEHLEFIARAYSLRDWEDDAGRLLARFEMDDKKDKLGKELSKGMQQKLSICCALLIKPKMVMFDEPMIGLDPTAIKELKSIFVELKSSGCAVLISTHLIDSVDEVWDKVLIMNKGKIVLIRTRSELDSKGESLERIFFEVIGKKEEGEE